MPYPLLNFEYHSRTRFVLPSFSEWEFLLEAVWSFSPLTGSHLLWRDRYTTAYPKLTWPPRSHWDQAILKGWGTLLACAAPPGRPGSSFKLLFPLRRWGQQCPTPVLGIHWTGRMLGSSWFFLPTHFSSVWLKGKGVFAPPSPIWFFFLTQLLSIKCQPQTWLDWIDECQDRLMRREQNFLCGWGALISKGKPAGPCSVM